MMLCSDSSINAPGCWQGLLQPSTCLRLVSSCKRLRAFMSYERAERSVDRTLEKSSCATHESVLGHRDPGIFDTEFQSIPRRLVESSAHKDETEMKKNVHCEDGTEQMVGKVPWS